MFFKPTTWIFIGSAIAIFAGFLSAREQSRHDAEVASRVEAGLAKMDRAVGYLTGGNSVPTISFETGTGDFSGTGDFILSISSGEFPLYDLDVLIAEYWYPEPGEQLPDGYWTFSNQRYGEKEVTTRSPKQRVVAQKKESILVPGRSLAVPAVKRTETLFPKTHKYSFYARIGTRGGVYLHYFSSRMYRSDEELGNDPMGNPNPPILWLQRSLTLDPEGKILKRGGDWIDTEKLPHGEVGSPWHPKMWYPLFPEETSFAGHAYTKVHS